MFATSIIDTNSGLTGFDSELEWYVSMQCVGDWHSNPLLSKFYLATKITPLAA